MSNPVINRWGLNLFWYKFWFSDFSVDRTFHQDSLIDQFILSYLNYGILYNKKVFFTKYWYNSWNFKNIINSLNLPNKYFRVTEYKNRSTGEFKKYKIRIKFKNTYFSRVWILRFQNWIVVNLYFFQPVKKINNKKINNNKRSINKLTSQLSDSKPVFKRIKMSIFLVYYNLMASNISYKF